MRKAKLKQKAAVLLKDIKLFLAEFSIYIFSATRIFTLHVNAGKTTFVTRLYRQRGRYAKRLMHSGMAGITALGVMIAPIVAQELPGTGVDPWEAQSPSSVLSASTTNDTETIIANAQVRSGVVEYEVEDGDTLSSIAQKFDIDTDTLRWHNDIDGDTIKPSEVVEVPPIAGIVHKVSKGDTVYSIAKKYDSEAQSIVNYPFNSFANDETFELAIGQTVMVPDGIKPQAKVTSPRRIRQVTPDAGTVVASGSFVWPAQGRLTQGYVWYHQGIDIANSSSPAVLAADNGTVVVAGWPDNYGYGNRVIVDHGNGVRTLYAHLSRIYVVPGQTVSRGSAVGQMGSTGRSTGTHLHFEVIQNGAHINPLSRL